MGKFQAPGRMSGRTYNFNIRGDLPTEVERGRIAQHIADSETAFAQQYQETMGQPLAAPEDDGTAIGRGFELGKAGAYSRLGSAAEYLGSGLGIDALRDYGKGMRQSGDTESFLETLRQPAPTELKDVKGLGSALTYLGEGVGQSAPEMFAPLAATAVGTMLGGPVAGVGAGAATAFPTFFGGNVQRQEAEVAAGRKSEVDVASAVTSAIGQSALNAIGDKLLLGGFLKPGQKWLTRTALGTVEGATTEIPTEITQQILERKQAGLPLDSDEAINEYINAGVLGGVLGGGVRGTTAMFQGQAAEDDTPPPPTEETQLELPLEYRPQLQPGQEEGDLFSIAPPKPREPQTEEEKYAEWKAESDAAKAKVAKAKADADAAQAAADAAKGTPDAPAAAKAAKQKKIVASQTEKQANAVDKKKPAEPSVVVAPPVEVQQELFPETPAVETPAVETPALEFSYGKERDKTTAGEARQVIATGNNGTVGAVEGTILKNADGTPSSKIQIYNSSLADELRGNGLGTQMYQEFISKAASEGLSVVSDTSVTPPAARVYAALGKLGYGVKQAENTVAEPDGRIKTQDGSPVFEIVSTPNEVQNVQAVNPEAVGASTEDAGLSTETGGSVPAAAGPAQGAEESVNGGVGEPADVTDGLGEPTSEQPAALSKKVADVADKIRNTYGMELTPAQLQELEGYFAPEPEGPKTDWAAYARKAPETAEEAGKTKLVDLTPRQINDFAQSLGSTDLSGFLNKLLTTPTAPTVSMTETKIPGYTEIRELQLVLAERQAIANDTAQEALEIAWKNSVPEEFIDDFETWQPDAEMQRKLPDITTADDKGKILELVQRTTKQLVGEANKPARNAQLYFSRFRRPIDAIQYMAELIRMQAPQYKAQEIEGVKPEASEKAFNQGHGMTTAQNALDWVMANLDPSTQAQVALLVSKELALAPAAAGRVSASTRRMAQFDEGREAYQGEVDTQVEKESVEAAQAKRELQAAISEAKAKAKAIADISLYEEQIDPELVIKRAEKRAADTAAAKAAEDARIAAEEEMEANFFRRLQEIGFNLKPRMSDIANLLGQRLASVTQNLLTNGNLRTALYNIAETSSEPRLAKLAMKMRGLVKETKVRMVDTLSSPDGRTMAAAYDPATDTILFNRSAPDSMTNVTVLHEVAHAITHKALNNPSLPITQQLTKLFEDAQKAIGPDTIGMNNIHEFVAEAFTNKMFRDMLQASYPNGGKFSAWQRFKNAVGNFIRRIFGAPANVLGSPMDDLDMHLDQLLDTSSDVVGPRPDPSQGLLYRASNDPKELTGVMARMFREEQKFGEPTKAFRDNWANRAKELYTNSKGLLSKGVLGFSSLLQLSDVATVAGIKNAPDLYDAVAKLDASTIASDREVQAALIRMQEWAKKFPEKRSLLNKIVAFSTINQVDPEKTRDVYTQYWLKYDPTGKFEDGIKYTGFKTAAERDAKLKELRDKYGKDKAKSAGNANMDKAALHDEMQASWKALGPEGRAIYNLMRMTYRKQFMAMRDAVGGKIDFALGANSTLANSVKSNIYERFFDFRSLEPYFPLVRKGEFWMQYTVRDPVTGEDEVVKEAFETRAERDRVRSLLKSEVPQVALDANGNPEVLMYENSGLERSRIGAPETKFVRDVLSALVANKVSEKAQNEISELFIDALPETSFARAIKGRSGVRGFESDALEAFRLKAFTLGRQAARYPFMQKVQEERDKIAAQGTGSATNDPVRMALIKELVMRADTAMHPPQGAWQEVAKAANQFAFTYTLGLNISSALVNLSAVPIVMVPYLSGKYGLANTTRATRAAYKLFLNSGFNTTLTTATNDVVNVKASPSIDNYFELKDVNGKMEYVLRTDLNLSDAQKKQMQDMLPLVKLAAAQGLLSRSLTYDTLGVENFGQNKTMLDKLSMLQGLPFHMVERSNRQVSLMASYQMELDRLRKNPTAAEKSMTDAQKQEQAAEKAAYMTAEMHGTHTLSTAPRYAQSGLGRIAMMFKSYGLNIAYMQFKMLKQGCENLFPGNDAEARALRNTAFKQLLGLQLSTALIAGVSGVPLYGLYRMVANMFLGDDEEDADMLTRKALGEWAFRGPLTEALGIDISSRTGLNDLLFRDNPYAKNQSNADFIAALIGGPAWSTGNQFLSGLNEMKRAALGQDGDFQRGLENMLPPLPRNVLQSIRFEAEGARTRRGDVVFNEFSLGQLLWKVTGFKPAELAQREEITRGAARMDKAVAQEKTLLLNRLNLAMSQGDRGEELEARKDIQEYNAKVRAKYPNMQITPETIKSSGTSFERVSARTHNGVTFNPATESYFTTLLSAYGAD